MNTSIQVVTPPRLPARRYRNKAGFTLSEIVIAVVVLGILASVVSYFVNGAREAAVLNAKEANVAVLNKLARDQAVLAPSKSTMLDGFTSVGVALTNENIATFKTGWSVANTNGRMRISLPDDAQLTPGSYQVAEPASGTFGTENYKPVVFTHDGLTSTDP